MSEVTSIPYRQRELHAGYRYEDLIAALAACELLLAEEGQLQIETAASATDVFKDGSCGVPPAPAPTRSKSK